MFRFERMLKEPSYAVKVAWMTAVVVGCVTLIFAIIGMIWPESWGKVANGYALVDAGLIFGLAYGVYRRSRACAVLLLVYWLGSKVIEMYELKRIPGGHAAIIALIFAWGVRATFELSRSAKEPSEKRYLPPPTAT